MFLGVNVIIGAGLIGDGIGNGVGDGSSVGAGVGKTGEDVCCGCRVGVSVDNGKVTGTVAGGSGVLHEPSKSAKPMASACFALNNLMY